MLCDICNAYVVGRGFWGRMLHKLLGFQFFTPLFCVLKSELSSEVPKGTMLVVCESCKKFMVEHPELANSIIGPKLKEN